MENNLSEKYPNLEHFSRAIGMCTKNLIEAFEIESAFHKKILKEHSFEKRKQMYSDVYNSVHPIYEKGKIYSSSSGERYYTYLVKQFKKEIIGKSILDIGCGKGKFLESVAKNLLHKELVGIDISVSQLLETPDVEFINGSIIEFSL